MRGAWQVGEENRPHALPSAELNVFLTSEWSKIVFTAIMVLLLKQFPQAIFCHTTRYVKVAFCGSGHTDTDQPGGKQTQVRTNEILVYDISRYHGWMSTCIDSYLRHSYKGNWFFAWFVVFSPFVVLQLISENLWSVCESVHGGWRVWVSVHGGWGVWVSVHGGWRLWVRLSESKPGMGIPRLK